MAKTFGDYLPSNRGNVGVALTCLFIGLGVGAAAALLFAPATGKQTRKALRRRYDDARDAVGDWSEQAGDALERGADWAREAGDTTREKIAPLARNLRRS